MERRFLGLGAALLAASLMSVCGGGSSGSGGGPTAPSPPPAPTPEPTPTPEPPLSMACAALPVGDPTALCKMEQAHWQDEVDNAIRTLMGEQPEIFDGNVVTRVGAYYVGLIGILDRGGLCGYYDGEEFAVTDNAGYNDQYDILSAKQGVRIGPVTYRSTCTPSAIPPPEAPLPPSPPGCPLVPSREVACSRQPDGGLYYVDVEGAIDQLLAEQPEMFDLGDTAGNTGWPRVRDLPAYHQAIVDILVGKGYCARDDGEEIAVKVENGFSEQYDVNYNDNYIRRGQGIYRATCYPAAF